MNWFLNLKIGAKLILGFILVAIISGIEGYFAITKMNALDERNIILYEKATVPVAQLGRMMDHFQRIRVNIRNIIIDPSKKDEYTEKVREYNNELLKESKDYEKTLIDKEDETQYADFVKMHAKFFEGIERFILLENSAEQVKMMNGELNLLYTPEQSQISKMMKYNEEGAKQVSNENSAISRSTATSMIILVLIAMALAIFLGIFISSVISKQIRELKEASDKIARGEINTEISIKSKDEIGDLTASFKKMKESIYSMIKNTLEKINSLNQSAEELLKMSEIAAASSEELQSQSNNNATASEQVAANVNTVAGSTEEMASSIKEISNNTTISAKLARESQESANITNEVMKKLGKSSQEIGNIIKSITSIAEQTNLLALNATIEAARAGESGKGFAVVANEVKELAKESAKATEDISSKIKNIQDDSKNAIESIDIIIENIGKVNDISNTIASAVEEQSVTTSDVNRNLAEASKGVDSIVAGSAGLLGTVNEFTKLAENLRFSAESLTKVAKELNDQIVNNYKI